MIELTMYPMDAERRDPPLKGYFRADAIFGVYDGTGTAKMTILLLSGAFPQNSNRAYVQETAAEVKAMIEALESAQ